MRFFILSLVVLITGCTTISDQKLSNNLKGLTEANLYECAGTPDIKRQVGSRTFVTYKRKILNSVGSFSCRTEISLKNNRVTSSKITVTRDNAFGAMRQQCSEIFKNCNI